MGSLKPHASPMSAADTLLKKTHMTRLLGSMNNTTLLHTHTHTAFGLHAKNQDVPPWDTDTSDVKSPSSARRIENLQGSRVLIYF